MQQLKAHFQDYLVTSVNAHIIFSEKKVGSKPEFTMICQFCSLKKEV